MANFKSKHSNAIQSRDTLSDADTVTDDGWEIIEIFVFYKKAIVFLYKHKTVSSRTAVWVTACGTLSLSRSMRAAPAAASAVVPMTVSGRQPVLGAHAAVGPLSAAQVVLPETPPIPRELDVEWIFWSLCVQGPFVVATLVPTSMFGWMALCRWWLRA